MNIFHGAKLALERNLAVDWYALFFLDSHLECFQSRYVWNCCELVWYGYYKIYVRLEVIARICAGAIDECYVLFAVYELYNLTTESLRGQ